MNKQLIEKMRKYTCQIITPDVYREQITSALITVFLMYSHTVLYKRFSTIQLHSFLLFKL